MFGIHDELLRNASARFIAPVIVLKANSALDIQPNRYFMVQKCFQQKF